MFIDYTTYLKRTYAILGILLLGMEMKKISLKYIFDIKFISLAMIIKFILWPVFILLFIFLDKTIFTF